VKVQPDERVARALLMLNQVEFKPLMEYLKARRESHRDTLETTPNEKFAGRALELKELIELVEGAPTLMAKLKTRNLG
jgi:plasmid replication initiation protein